MSAARGFISSFEVFARTAETDSELDVACRTAAADLGADGVGVSLALPTTLRTLIGASDRTTHLLEHAELTAGEGPCTTATRTGRPVVAADLTDPADGRWPGLVHLLDAVPVRAVTAVPLIVDGHPIGSVNVHSSRARGLDALSHGALEAVAATVTRAALRSRPPEPDRATTLWRQISVATGMVMGRLSVASEDAVSLLRAEAFRDGRWLGDVAYDVVSGRRAADLGGGPPDHRGLR